MQNKKLYLLSYIVFFSLIAFSQIPDGYYDAAKGLSGEPLREALHDIISEDAVKVPYGSGSLNGIWGVFRYSDVFPAPNQTRIWDMYSDIPDGTASYYYNLGTDQCGSASGEGDCYSREHSFPKSYWGGGGQSGSTDPQYTDLFHLFPADQYVNNRRNNYPYGEVTNPYWTSTNGGKLGTNTFSSYYGGTAFEPINAYKGDIARGYFYMATRYMDKFSSWEKITEEGDVIMNGNGYSDWFLEMLLGWSASDPVSQKEIDRNNAIFYKSGQGNRNPYIDHPEYVSKVWGGTAVSSQTPKTTFLFPNPARDFIHVTSAESFGSYKIINVIGQTVQEGVLSESTIYIGGLFKGRYILQLKNQLSVMSLPLIVI